MRSLFSKVSIPATRRVVASSASSLLRQRVVSSSLLRLQSRTATVGGLYAPARTMATAPKAAGKPKAAAAPVPAVAKPSPAAQLVQVKTELASILAKEREEVGGDMTGDHPYVQYVKEHNLNIEFDAKDGGAITITKSIHGYDVTAKFNATPDPDENENPFGQNQNENENEEGKDGKEDGAEEEEAFNYSFIVNVTPSGKADAPTFNLFAISSKDAKLYFEGLSIGKAAGLGDFPETDFNDLPTAAQDKIADLMDLLKIDDEFAQFVPAAAAETSRLNHLKALTKLQQFVDSK